MRTGKFLRKIGEKAVEATVPAASILSELIEDDDADTNDAILAVLCRISEQLEHICIELEGLRQERRAGPA